MAAMATAQPLTSGEPIATGPRHPKNAWAWWIGVSVLGAVLGALAASQIRSLYSYGPATLGDLERYVATIVEAMIAAGCQWLLLRRYKVDPYWWVPATVAANLISAILLIPAVLGLFTPPLGIGISSTAAIISGGAALAASGLVIGVAQALVLRPSVGNVAWAWVPVTVLGGALAGAATEAMSPQISGLPIYGLPPFLTLALLAFAGSLLRAACQTPVVMRILR